MAYALRMLDRHHEALPLAAECVEFSTMLNGPESSETIESIEDHALILITVGRIVEGKAMLERVLEDTCLRCWPSGHPQNQREPRQVYCVGAYDGPVKRTLVDLVPCVLVLVVCHCLPLRLFTVVSDLPSESLTTRPPRNTARMSSTCPDTGAYLEAPSWKAEGPGGVHK
mmetsp:Transcript_25160/g.100127  ORF Transcript_25160/g.100127 Transcript_25160/m.100127 type:complete len:170 (-) Transcript_25160:1485-1994(-)